MAEPVGPVGVTLPLLQAAQPARTAARAIAEKVFVISINVDASIKVLAPVFFRLL